MLKKKYSPSYVVVEPLGHVVHTVYFRQGDIHASAFSFVFVPLGPNDSKTTIECDGILQNTENFKQLKKPLTC